MEGRGTDHFRTEHSLRFIGANLLLMEGRGGAISMVVPKRNGR